jgi:enoyl-CoA hydratase
MKFETLSLKNDGAVWTLTIERPKALNALNSQVLGEIGHALDEINGKSFTDCRCLIITGSGEKAFVAGADIKELNTLNEASGKKFAEGGQALFRRLEKLKVPVIAAVNGFCLGGGFELALACDFIYASENAKFALPEVSLGIIPGFGGTVRLSRIVGLARAKEMIFSADMVPAAEAFASGIVNKVLPQAELMAAVMKTANSIASRAPTAISQAKISVMNAFDQDVDQAMQTEAKQFSNLFTTADFKEGTSAFLEKRKAQFKGQ